MGCNEPLGANCLNDELCAPITCDAKGASGYGEELISDARGNASVVEVEGGLKEEAVVIVPDV